MKQGPKQVVETALFLYVWSWVMESNLIVTLVNNEHDYYWDEDKDFGIHVNEDPGYVEERLIHESLMLISIYDLKIKNDYN